MRINVRLNGVDESIDVVGSETLLDLLRTRQDLGSAGSWCEEGTCGRCTVSLEGSPVYSCLLLAASCRDRELSTAGFPQTGERSPAAEFGAEGEVSATAMEAMTFLHHTELPILLQALNEGKQTFRPIAGGSDLVPLMKRGAVRPEAVLDISRVESLRTLRAVPGSGLLMGALMTLAQVAADPRLIGPFGAVAEAAVSAGPPQIRNVGTIAGNLLQRPRCPYLRAAANCWLQGGEACFAREGENLIAGIYEDSPCVATHPSDLATALFALGAAVHTRSAWIDRAWPIDMFMRPPFVEYRDETALEASELITAVQLPEPPEGLRSVYVKETAPDWSFALVGVALAGIVEGRRIRDLRLALGGVATVPRRSRAAESILMSAEVDDALVAAAAEAALEGVRALSQNAYKLPMLTATIGRAIERLLAGRGS